MTSTDEWAPPPGTYAHVTSADTPKRVWALGALGAWLVLTFVLGMVARFTVFDIEFIPSPGMAPTLQVGDRIVVDRTAYRRGSPERGDVVLFAVPEDKASQPGMKQVKRIVGLGGDTVECCDSAGRVVVNGIGIDEPYAGRTEPFPGTTVPAGSMFLLGDNRERSADSRVTGPLGEEVLDGRVVGIGIGRVVLVIFGFGAAAAAVLVTVGTAFLALLRRRRRA